jgi:hypothetical protein
VQYHRHDETIASGRLGFNGGPLGVPDVVAHGERGTQQQQEYLSSVDRFGDFRAPFLPTPEMRIRPVLGAAHAFVGVKMAFEHLEHLVIVVRVGDETVHHSIRAKQFTVVPRWPGLGRDEEAGGPSFVSEVNANRQRKWFRYRQQSSRQDSGVALPAWRCVAGSS